MRYSYQKTHRVLPATLPHGDAGVTFGAGDGNIKAQGLAFNDTHTFSSNLLNEFRFGWTLDQVLHDADRLRHEPGRRRSASRASTSTTPTSAMTQITFQNIRNLGANSNQPLITNQNDFQIFDNVTKISGKHTLKAGRQLHASARARS